MRSRSTSDDTPTDRPRDADVFAEAPTVVFVHGAMDRAASFGRVARRLDAFDVVSYDRRGYAGSIDASSSGAGPSDPTAGAGGRGSIAAHADDLAAVIEWSGSGHVVVVGHSLGGTIALELAGRADQRLAGVVAFESPMPSLDGSHAEVGGGAVQIAERHGAAAGAEHFSRLMLGDATWERLRERDRRARLAEGPALLAELTDLRRPERPTPEPPSTLTVTVGAGGRSSARLREGARRLHEHLRGSRLVEIAGAGHGAHLTHPDEFARLSAGARSEVADGRRTR